MTNMNPKIAEILTKLGELLLYTGYLAFQRLDVTSRSMPGKRARKPPLKV